MEKCNLVFNYGQSSVDVFAPGSAIYSTYPKNEYEYAQGTSMASPLVAGVAALVWSQYPKLRAAEVKQIIMSSGLSLSLDVDAGDEKNIPFTEISKSGKLINAYNALIMASNVSK